jgi:hypothetical protein
MFCELCEDVTTQELEKLQILGSGEPGAQVWRCLDGDHIWGARPKPTPSLEEPATDDAARAWEKTLRYLVDTTDHLEALLNPTEHGLVSLPAEAEAKLRVALEAVRGADPLFFGLNPRAAT